MVISSTDKVCVLGLHRSGTSSIAAMLCSLEHKYCGEITSAIDFVKTTFPIKEPNFSYFTPWQELYQKQYPGIEKFQSISKRLEYIESTTQPIVYKVLVNELTDMDIQEIEYIKSTIIKHKVVLCLRPFRDIIISLLVRPSIRNWLVANKHYDVLPNGVEKDMFTDSISINVPYNKQLIQSIVEQKPKHINMMKQIKEFVADIPNHVVIQYQDNLGNHPWLKPYHDKSNQQYVKNPFTYNFEYDVELIVDRVKNQCDYWY